MPRRSRLAASPMARLEVPESPRKRSSLLPLETSLLTLIQRCLYFISQTEDECVERKASGSAGSTAHRSSEIHAPHVRLDCKPYSIDSSERATLDYDTKHRISPDDADTY